MSSAVIGCFNLGTVFLLTLFASVSLASTSPGEEGLKEGIEYIVSNHDIAPELTNERCTEPCEEKKKSPFTARVIFEIVTDPGAHKNIEQYKNCFNNASPTYQQNQNDILNNIYTGVWTTADQFKDGLKPYKKSWSTEEKLCFVSTYMDLIADYYEIDDLIGKNISTTDEMRVLKDGEGSAGVCIHIHRSGSEIGNALGLNCGQVSTEWDKNNKRGGHSVSVCKDGSADNPSYYLINYGKTFKLDAKTYQEAIDSTSLFLGPMNANGDSMTCYDPDMNMWKNCNHIYLPRDTRWGLSLIRDGLDQLSGGENLVVRLSNVSQGGSLVFGDTKSKEKTTKDGSRKIITTSSGLVIVHETFRGGENQFSSLGYGVHRRSDSSRGNSELLVYFGGYYASADNPLPGTYVDGDKKHAAGFLVYSKGRLQRYLSPTTTLTLTGEIVGASSPHFKDAGYTGVFGADLDQRLDKHTSIFLAYEGGILGSHQNNLPLLSDPHVSGGFRFQVGDEDSKFELKDELTFHYLGHQSTAIENEGEVTLRLIPNTYFTAKSHVGETFSQDVFYDNGTWMENGAQIGLDLDVIKVGLEATHSTGQLPAQFGQGLLIEDNPIPTATASNYYVGFRIEGVFGRNRSSD
jgi:hypothetical protein